MLVEVLAFLFEHRKAKFRKTEPVADSQASGAMTRIIATDDATPQSRHISLRRCIHTDQPGSPSFLRFTLANP
jgi:hypothetical protein